MGSRTAHQDEMSRLLDISLKYPFSVDTLPHSDAVRRLKHYYRGSFHFSIVTI